MKFQLAVLVSSALASYAPLSALAAECSAAQQTAANVLGDGAEFETACADVFNADPSGDAALDPASLLSGNASTLAVLAPCKQPSCAAFLKKQADKVPDCEVSGVNARLVFTTIVDFCSNATASAPKSASGKSAGSGSGSGSTLKIAGSDSGSEAGIVTVPSPEKKGSETTTSAPAETVGDKDQDKVTNANTKSDASSGAYAGATAIVAGALLTVLCM